MRKHNRHVQNFEKCSICVSLSWVRKSESPPSFLWGRRGKKRELVFVNAWTMCTTFCPVVLAYWLYINIYTYINIHTYSFVLLACFFECICREQRNEDKQKLQGSFKLGSDKRSFENKNTKKNTEARASRWNRSLTRSRPYVLMHFRCGLIALAATVAPSLHWWRIKKYYTQQLLWPFRYYALVMRAWEENWGVVNFVDSCVVSPASVLSCETLQDHQEFRSHNITWRTHTKSHGCTQACMHMHRPCSWGLLMLSWTGVDFAKPTGKQS